jgi:hypothetical protein
LKAADPDRLAAVLAQAKALAKGLNPAGEDAALTPFGEADPIDCSVEASIPMSQLQSAATITIASATPL